MNDCYRLSHLRVLEAEAIHVLREVAAEARRPALMFSGGKDSAVLLHLARQAFRPAPVPFPVLHVDTGHNFPEVLAFRDRIVTRAGLRLVVASVPDMIADGRITEAAGQPSRNRLQTPALLDAVAENDFDALFGGARRDEDKARAKERVLSFRDEFGQWDPKNQRPEVWHLYNGLLNPGEHLRAFPLSNWTELDVWHYIRDGGVEVPSLYYAHKREVFERDGMLLPTSPLLPLRPGETTHEEMVRFRTVGDMSCTGAVASRAATVDEVIHEVAASRITERGATRADDRTSESAMEDRKREGYF
jgi:sulfate adenylyltransferase subunit 2